jgi:hypothetical protein
MVPPGACVWPNVFSDLIGLRRLELGRKLGLCYKRTSRGALKCRPFARLRDEKALPLTATESHMDLSYLYHRRGVSLLMATKAACERSRAAHRKFAVGYSERIEHALRINREVRA